MEILIRDLAQHTQKDSFAINIDGWWGDADEFSNTTEYFPNTAKGQRDFVTTVLALRKYQAQHKVECPSDLEKSKDFTKKEKAALENVLRIDNGGMYLSHFDVAIKYYDEKGYERVIELKE